MDFGPGDTRRRFFPLSSRVSRRLPILPKETDSSNRNKIQRRQRVTYPQSQPDGVENSGSNKVPANCLVDLVREPLEDDKTPEQEVNQGPDIEGEVGRGNVRLVLRVIGTIRVLVPSKGRVQVTREEKEVNEDVGDLGRPVVKLETHCENEEGSVEGRWEVKKKGKEKRKQNRTEKMRTEKSKTLAERENEWEGFFFFGIELACKKVDGRASRRTNVMGIALLCHLFSFVDILERQSIFSSRLPSHRFRMSTIDWFMETRPFSRAGGLFFDNWPPQLARRGHTSPMPKQASDLRRNLQTWKGRKKAQERKRGRMLTTTYRRLDTHSRQRNILTPHITKTHKSTKETGGMMAISSPHVTALVSG